MIEDTDPDPGDPKRPDPTGSGSRSATLKMTVNVGHYFNWEKFPPSLNFWSLENSSRYSYLLDYLLPLHCRSRVYRAVSCPPSGRTRPRCPAFGSRGRSRSSRRGRRGPGPSGPRWRGGYPHRTRSTSYRIS